MKYSIVQHFIWIFTVCKSTRLGFLKYKGLTTYLELCHDFTALLIKLGKFTGSCLIYGGGIESLKQASIVDDGIELGAALTINELDVKLKELSGKIKGMHFWPYCSWYY